MPCDAQAMPAAAVRARRVALILALGAVVLVPQLFLRDVWGPDETRFAEVAREMIVSGDYIVPHLNGTLYAEKPPVFFWLTAAVWPLFGVNAGRVVAAAAGLGALLLTHRLGRRLYGAAEGLWAALVMASCLLFIGVARAGILDSLLLLAILAAVNCGYEGLEGAGRRAGAAWLGFYASLALGALIKGPVVLVGAGLVVLAYALAYRKSVRGGGWWHLAGAGLFAALVAAWLVPAMVAGGKEYFRYLVVEQAARRVSGTMSHEEPFYYYLLRWPLYFFPWSLVLPLALAGAWRAGGREARLPVMWFVVLFVAYSAVAGKGERYVLPLVPAAALACGRHIGRAAGEGVTWSRLNAAAWGGSFVVMLSLAAGLWTVAAKPALLAQALTKDARGPALVTAQTTPARRGLAAAAGAVVAACALGGLRLLRRGDGERRRAATLLAAMATVALSFDLVALGAMDEFKAERRLVAEMAPYLGAADELYLHATDYGGIVNLFTRREKIPVLETFDDVAAAVASPRRVAVVMWKKEAGKMLGTPRFHIIPEHAEFRNPVLVVNWEPAPTPSQP
ncbi:MAG TPA: glycosyltransferase family 39 protein [Planctomycetota bacterium]|nr:glycosyltransferase family 39 protein [Planctomycetota bacterium]HRR80769.1 glycosyltransferase family 39 protein [Planctomycetota bacterium]HRT95081.1 glycosyltransferase family 39 protein [Planctomycetota bacterium]